jgi:hypothetical protein
MSTAIERPERLVRTIGRALQGPAPAVVDIPRELVDHLQRQHDRARRLRQPLLVVALVVTSPRSAPDIEREVRDRLREGDCVVHAGDTVIALASVIGAGPATAAGIASRLETTARQHGAGGARTAHIELSPDGVVAEAVLRGLLGGAE